MYQRPEIVEVGAAAELTLGIPDCPVADRCGCSQPLSDVER
ncbi:MAG TPA: lasso RiPP family leader peptide-containing protein [Longimicrobium sp.]|nr:lasso RiPP family leader peptide-containing protein [Longimicrobium sp.]